MKFKIELTKTVDVEAENLTEARAKGLEEARRMPGAYDTARLVLSREDAQRIAQERVAAARVILDEAEALADEYRFILEQGYQRYLPKNLTAEEKSYDGILGMRISEYQHGGEWLSSSQYKDC